MQAKGKTTAKPEAKTPTKSDNKSTVTKDTAKPAATKSNTTTPKPATKEAAKTTTKETPRSTNTSALPSKQNSKATLDVKKNETKPSPDMTRNKNTQASSLTNKKTETKSMTTPKPAEKKLEAPKVDQKDTRTEKTNNKTSTNIEHINVKNSKEKDDISVKHPQTERAETKDKEIKDTMKEDLEQSMLSKNEIKSDTQTMNLLNDERSDNRHKFDLNKLRIERTEFFPEIRISSNHKLTFQPNEDIEVKDSKNSKENKETENQINDISQNNYEKEQEKEKEISIKLKKELHTKTYLINRRDELYEESHPPGKILNRFISPEKTIKGISIFSKYNMEDLFSSSHKENRNKVLFDKNFMYHQSSNSKTSTSPFKNTLKKTEHLNYLKELKNGYAFNSDLSGLLVPPNAMAKNTLLSTDNIFNREYNNILELQKIGGGISTKSSTTLNKFSTKKKSLLETNYLPFSPVSYKRDRGMSNKGADMYVKLFDKIRKK